ncbi:substrate-binding domain-containing protein [Pseudonocardia cypriaca]|uniref:substrate-binding domain-containing protein n=1 Tax=Pseudonocardia cypriaca TaxID=882449 RepID=UPI0014778394|nr:substrate-binding domain-containing protein [Pseudonocardia cypriaca]
MGYEAALALLRSTDPPTAIFAMSGYSALGVIGAYRDNGLIVGQDFALVGYHDISISAQLSIPSRACGRHWTSSACRRRRLLLSRMAGEEVESVRLPPVLQVRDSRSRRWRS